MTTCNSSDSSASATSDQRGLERDRIEKARFALERKWALIALTGKVPVHKGWQKTKQTPISLVERWLRHGRNLGVRTGAVSGVVVIDDDSLDGSASAALDLPKTVTAITGSGKRHFYFRAPGFKVGNSVKTLAPGIDVRGDGGQVVLVGGIHPDTKQPYSWAPGLSPAEVDFADVGRRRRRAEKVDRLAESQEPTEDNYHLARRLGDRGRDHVGPECR